MCEYCEEGNGVGKALLHDENFESLYIVILNGMLWDKTYDCGIEINYCPMCRTKTSRKLAEDGRKGGKVMTKEQEEAIEYLKQFSELMKKWEATEIFSNIETVLNMLKEKDEEIEE